MHWQSTTMKLPANLRKTLQSIAVPGGGGDFAQGPTHGQLVFRGKAPTLRDPGLPRNL